MLLSELNFFWLFPLFCHFSTKSNMTDSFDASFMTFCTKAKSSSISGQDTLLGRILFISIRHGQCFAAEGTVT